MILRDNQRQRVYDAEDAVGSFYNHKLSTEDAVMSFIDDVCSIPSVRKLYKHYTKDGTILVGFKPKTWRHNGEANDEGLSINHSSMDTKTAIHELAHVIQYRMKGDDDFAMHDQSFTSVLLNLVEAMFGMFVRAKLEESFDNNNVKY